MEVFYSLGLGFSYSGIYWSPALIAVLIYVTADRSLYLGFNLSFYSFLDQNTTTIKLLVFFIDPKPDWWLQVFVKVFIQNLFSWGISNIKFLKYKLELYQVKSLIFYFFLLILKVLFNLALDMVYNYNWFSKALLKKNLELIPGKKFNLILFF